MSHLNACKIISDDKHGFYKRPSAELQLICTIHKFACNLNERKQTGAILLDFCKAIDNVSHCYLKLKLEYYKVRNQTLKWISSFVEDHIQCIVCGDCTLDPANVISGVPNVTSDTHHELALGLPHYMCGAYAQ